MHEKQAEVVVEVCIGRPLVLQVTVKVRCEQVLLHVVALASFGPFWLFLVLGGYESATVARSASLERYEQLNSS